MRRSEMSCPSLRSIVSCRKPEPARGHSADAIRANCGAPFRSRIREALPCVERNVLTWGTRSDELMLIRQPRPGDSAKIQPSEITPESVYLDRRRLLQAALAAGVAGLRSEEHTSEL